ncbi:RdgB/HAM1 family non-canonical purine NTP pyrophosphatase [Demequina sp. SYSU T00039]|uniref:dITP/XTP pyrophosphatase n=1 Tax=Demequina lignilytica TaxID=3051663 RepID=A0AAW7M7D8_9MICO|nr:MULTISPECIES: RdgB/HAM1 family non-canonical purine NTP pyrophosphatase [unclassified Demequina]MDN4478886.1 RdgB/HAM1 family non-canonical purine NTP pyrophosphatase [Demequina sp. SYSU T00039-1]MDN4488761.1 RdgB/HAM1 family non-canonical purine NTP pyrophosphatase [Demequina sp. SYSU T00039]MDN4491855.1 RdgB/HAM1 family non-canonical purine NTP pyrophosphatase [Demequina sp. SYSU T00068]
MPRLAIATHNSHKVGEIWGILAPLVPGLSRDDVASARELGAPSPVEDGVTFAENALIKARALAASTGLPAIADDSGIAVDVMGGAPGIFSALWSGRHGADRENLELLLAQMADIPDEHRGARFVCAAVLVTPDGVEHTCVAHQEGELLRAPAGEGGFGYDPIFRAHGEAVSNAELTPERKNEISHRGRAFRMLAPHVAEVLGA